jgi:hypothetical protein
MARIAGAVPSPNGSSRRNCWGSTRETARIGAALPPEQSLVIPTDGLSTRLDTLAPFAGLPRSALYVARSHANRGEGKIPLVAALPDLPRLLERSGLGPRNTYAEP